MRGWRCCRNAASTPYCSEVSTKTRFIQNRSFTCVTIALTVPFSASRGPIQISAFIAVTFINLSPKSIPFDCKYVTAS